MTGKLLFAGAVVAVIALLAGVLPIQRATADPPIAITGGCPTGWYIGTLDMVWPWVDVGNWKDQNGDGLLCFRPLEPTVPGWLWKDNNNPIF